MASFIPPTAGELSWRVARRCNSGSCVRVAASGDSIIIGDSKDPDGPVLTYSRREWLVFADGIKNGDSDAVM